MSVWRARAARVCAEATAAGECVWRATAASTCAEGECVEGECAEGGGDRVVWMARGAGSVRAKVEESVRVPEWGFWTATARAPMALSQKPPTFALTFPQKLGTAGECAEGKGGGRVCGGRVCRRLCGGRRWASVRTVVCQRVCGG